MTNNKAFINGKVLTMDTMNQEVEAFIVEGDKISLMGTTNEILENIDPSIEIIDLMGRRVLPGMNDSHMHLISYGLSTQKVDLRQCKSLHDVKDQLIRFIENEKEDYFDGWIVGHGWNDENFQEGMYPIASFLDDISSNRPIYLSRACYHIAAVNSKALQLAGIDDYTPDPEGGKIDRDAKGKATGILRENALLLAYEKISISDDIEVMQKLIEASIEDALKVGLTSIQTEDFGHVKDFWRVLHAYEGLEKEGRLKLRINLQMLMDIEKLKAIIDKGFKTGTGGDMLKFGPLKVLADGSLGGRTAALLEDYCDEKGNNGILIYNDERLLELLRLAADNDLQLAVHAIGDRTMLQVLDAYQLIYGDDTSKRSRIIHCQITNDEIINRMSKQHVIADIQPGFLMTDMKMIINRVGSQRGEKSYNWKSMLEKKVPAAGGSDAPIESFNPFLGIYAAVTRKDLEGKPEGGFHPKQCLTLDEAISLYTLGSSYATFEESKKGMLKKGYLADFIVLDRDIKKISPNEIKDIVVEETYVGGVCKYKR